jgi:protein-export membrane protein SecD
MLCPRCGSELSEGSNVCRFCKDIPVDSLTFPEPLAATPTLTPATQPAGLDTPRQNRSAPPARRIVLVVMVALLVAGAAIGFALFKQSGNTREWQAVVVLEAESTAQQQVTPEKLQRCVQVIEERLSDLDLGDFQVEAGEYNTVVISLAQEADVAEIAAVVLRQGRVGFYALADFGASYSTESEALAAAGVASEEGLPAGTSLIVWSADGSDSGADEYYLVAAAAAVTGEALDKAGYDTRTTNGSFRVTLEFNDEGAALFAEITGTLADIGAVQGGRQRLAIVVDGEVLSAPGVDERIEGGSAEITGTFTLEEAKSLALVLNTGALPLLLTVAGEREEAGTTSSEAIATGVDVLLRIEAIGDCFLIVRDDSADGHLLYRGALKTGEAATAADFPRYWISVGDPDAVRVFINEVEYSLEGEPGIFIVTETGVERVR